MAQHAAGGSGTRHVELSITSRTSPPPLPGRFVTGVPVVPTLLCHLTWPLARLVMLMLGGFSELSRPPPASCLQSFDLCMEGRQGGSSSDGAPCFVLQVAAFHMLTGWPQEDLLDPLGGTTLSAGELYDRLEKAVGGPLAPLQVPGRNYRQAAPCPEFEQCPMMLYMAPAASKAQLAEQHTAAPPRALQPSSKMLLCWHCHAILRCCFCYAVVQEPAAVASCCLIKRSSPPRMPPRLVVLTGPSAVGRAKLVARLIDEFPDKFGATISHTSRTPKEHEVDGRY
jgi:hypothetical protein